MYFLMKMTQFILFIYQNKFGDCMDILLINNKNKSCYIYYIYIKNFNRFMFNKTKCKN